MAVSIPLKDEWGVDMGRRIQGFIQQRKYNDHPQKVAGPEWNHGQETKEPKLHDDGMINISQAQLVSGIVNGLANAADKPCKTQRVEPDAEISEELINMLAAKIKERQNTNHQSQGNTSKENRQGQSEQSKLQELVAKLLLGGKAAQQNQLASNVRPADNPILAANDKANQQSNAQNNAQNPQLKTNMTATVASQVLAEAQYELSKELETSLQKLRQVIEESKQVVQKINNLLEQNNGGNNGNNSQN